MTAPIALPTIDFDYNTALSIKEMMRLDQYAIRKYHVPKLLMLESAGYQLARLAAANIPRGGVIEMGIGPSDNGSGGLVAARRLAAWGYKIFLDIPDINLSDGTLMQANRAMAFGADLGRVKNPDLFIDCYFGFTQKIPLADEFINRILDINQYLCKKMSFDIPTGLTEVESDHPFVFADVVCALGAPKKVLNNPELTSQVFVADIGIPPKAFIDLGLVNLLPFHEDGLVQILM